LNRSWFVDEPVWVDCNYLWNQFESIVDLGEGNVLTELNRKSVKELGICKFPLYLVIEVQIDGSSVELIV